MFRTHLFSSSSASSSSSLWIETGIPKMENRYMQYAIWRNIWLANPFFFLLSSLLHPLFIAFCNLSSTRFCIQKVASCDLFDAVIFYVFIYKCIGSKHTFTHTHTHAYSAPHRLAIRMGHHKHYTVNWMYLMFCAPRFSCFPVLFFFFRSLRIPWCNSRFRSILWKLCAQIQVKWFMWILC